MNDFIRRAAIIVAILALAELSDMLYARYQMVGFETAYEELTGGE